MKRKVTVLWIDDNPEREEDAINTASAIEDLNVEFIRADQFVAEGSDLQNNFYNIIESSNVPDLFIIDFRLDRKAEGKIGRGGLSVASQIREKQPDVPIYGFSEDYEKPDQSVLRAHEHEYFDRVLTMPIIEGFGSEILYYDALDFYMIRKAKSGFEGIIKLLKAPKSSHDFLLKVMPEIFCEGVENVESGENPKSNPISFARWVQRELLAFPGPLYDELYTATHLGMTLKRFNKIAKEFGAAEYSGVFSRGLNEHRWWVLEINKVLFSNKKAKKFDDTAPWALAPKVYKIKERTKCEVCKRENPETVGININNKEIRKPVHYSCSVPHPKMKRKMFYDEIRAYPID